MNIYKNGNEILCSQDGCPNGWQVLGYDNTITNNNKIYVIGFDNGKAVLDLTKIDFDNKINRKSEIINLLNEIDKKSIRPLRSNELDRVNELESQAQLLRNELNSLGV